MSITCKICFLNRHNTKENSFRLHSHNCYETIYFLSGNGTIIIKDKSYPFSANTYCIIPPETEHIECIEGYGEILFIGFEYQNERHALQEGVYYNGEFSGLDLFGRIFEEYKEQSLDFEDAANALLKLFLITVCRNGKTDSKKGKDLNHIKEYIEQHFDQKIDFKELASVSGYSYDYFRRIFKQYFSISPQQYMIDIRIRQAERMLRTTDLSCAEIAYCCGFSNHAQMTTMLKNAVGKTPLQLRNDR